MHAEPRWDHLALSGRTRDPPPVPVSPRARLDDRRYQQQQQPRLRLSATLRRDETDRSSTRRRTPHAARWSAASASKGRHRSSSHQIERRARDARVFGARTSANLSATRQPNDGRAAHGPQRDLTLHEHSFPQEEPVTRDRKKNAPPVPPPRRRANTISPRARHPFPHTPRLGSAQLGSAHDEQAPPLLTPRA
ncbi:hypothetical protein HETIRDRAFT_455758 [Heterobasidion irregulare TC 32-1]|uniref:Uncharacterized protein n=1 Tax=Heterobasidion irregulare (strain TC 32-1) TaxID=747525 RepID=W4JRN5_HETIT|nr:uncharacterized protein HETIRDRAFT_455758 [Heterobasidion irregulare TC 32-1]ETW76237.1 hypothetical protein HETIRDRAFT_455758 [Heterobasidion irregulare TC 32-1]